MSNNKKSDIKLTLGDIESKAEDLAKEASDRTKEILDSETGDKLDKKVNALKEKADQFMESDDGQKMAKAAGTVLGKVSDAGEKFKGTPAGKEIFGEDGKFDESDVDRLAEDAKKAGDKAVDALNSLLKNQK